VASELDAARDVKQSTADPLVVVISDFAKGTKLEALQNYEWPKTKPVHVVTRRVTSKQKTNAFVQLLTSEDDSPDAEPRVRVASVADSKDDQFFVAWGGGASNAALHETAVYVPPGQSRVVKLPRPEDNLQADRIVLRGDDHEFDNTHFVVPPQKQQVKLLYAGSDEADDEQGPQYYLKLATGGDPLRQVEIQPFTGEQEISAQPPPQIVVATQKLSAAAVAALKEYVERGGTLVLAPSDAAAAQAVTSLLDDVESAAKPSATTDYLLLGEIDFSHPLFSPFANPRYSDFTKIHFWKHRSFVMKEGATTQAVAKFDNGEPALLERQLGKGRVLVFASGWQPEESQLALSTKFVPMIAALLDRACGATEALASVTIGETVQLPATGADSTGIIHKPDGQEIKLTLDQAPLTTHQALSFRQTDQPGIYDISAGENHQRFAVNLPTSESNTAPLELEQLEQLGVKTGNMLTRRKQLDRIRQQRDTELESRQKIWRWLIVAVLGILIVETVWAGYAARQIARAEAPQ
jgi:hypothetical protein